MRWSYKTIRFGLKKEGLLGSAFLDESEIEYALNEFGKSGWELVSFVEVQDGLVGVLKQPLGQGVVSFEDVSTAEDFVEREASAEAPPIIRRSVSPPVEDEREAGEEALKNDPEQEDGEPDDTDVGSIRIE